MKKDENQNTKSKPKMLLELYLTFLKIGSFTVGGGYAMLPIMQTEAVDNKKWCTEEEVVNYITVAQSLPGMFAANVSGSIGNKMAGTLGAIVSVLGTITPSLVIISIFATYYDILTKPGMLQDFFVGLRYGVYSLILIASFRMHGSAVKSNFQKVLFITIFILYFIFNVSPFILIIFGTIIGIIYRLAFERGVKND
ncbi:MAG: chromate transporter [Lachnospirales bacterium]